MFGSTRSDRRLRVLAGCAMLAIATLSIGEPASASPEPVQLSALSSSAGSAVGGDVVMVTGVGLTQVKYVEFGAARTGLFRSVSPNMLSVVVPAHVVGQVAVRVVTSHGVTGTSPASSFRYFKVATGSLVSSGLSPQTGGSVNAIGEPNRNAADSAPAPGGVADGSVSRGGAPAGKGLGVQLAPGGAVAGALPLYIDQARYYGATNSASMVRLGTDDVELSAARGANGSYLSSELQTNYFTYGTVAVRAKLSAGTGMWPAIWMVPQVSGPLGTPEIDLEELPQTGPGQTNVGHFTYHWTASNGIPWSIGTEMRLPFDLTTSYHTYKVAWLPGSITWWVDNIQVLHVETDPSGSTGVATSNAGTSAARIARPSVIPIFSGPMHLLLNNGVGSAGSWASQPNATTPFPNTMAVQSVSITPLGGSQMLAQAGSFSLSVG